jgi:hypothetical protein
MSIERRLEKLEAKTTGAETRETPTYVRVYFKHLENHRRQEAGEPPIPLTPEEERYERETEKDPAWRAYLEKIDEQIQAYEFE